MSSVFLEAPASRFRGLRESLFLVWKPMDFVALKSVEKSLRVCHECTIETQKLESLKPNISLKYCILGVLCDRYHCNYWSGRCVFVPGCCHESTESSHFAKRCQISWNNNSENLKMFFFCLLFRGPHCHRLGWSICCVFSFFLLLSLMVSVSVWPNVQWWQPFSKQGQEMLLDIK